MSNTKLVLWQRILIGAGILLALAVVLLLLNPLPPRQFTISTGGVEGGYTQYATLLQTRLARDDFDLDLKPGAGSVETLERLIAGDTDIGLVQGGTTAGFDTSDLRAIGSVFYEPIWVFHRGNLTDLRGLTGWRVAVGETGSGVQPVALRLLKDNGVTSDNSTFLELSNDKAAAQLLAGEIDAAFFIIAANTALIDTLIREPDIHLLSFRRALAYSSRYDFLTQVELGEGMIDLVENIPAEPKTLLATTAMLVTRREMHNDVVRLMLRTAQAIQGEEALFQQADEFPSAAFIELPMHAAAGDYLQNGDNWFERNLPFWLAGLTNRLVLLVVPLFAVLYWVVRSALPLYSLGIRLRITRWYLILNRIDRRVDHLETEDIPQEIERLQRLQREITRRNAPPFIFMDTLYTLKIHIRLVLARLQERLQED